MARSEHHIDGLQYYNQQLTYRGYTLFSSDNKAYLIDRLGSVVQD